MKILSNQELDHANNLFLTEGLKGGAVALIASSSLLMLINRSSFKSKFMTLPFKAFFISSMTTAGFVIHGEHALIAYDRAQHADLRASSPFEIEIVKDSAPLTTLLKAKNFVSEHRYQIIGGSWLIGMSIAGIYLHRQKYLTTTQKLVEARMYAQGITLASLGMVAAFSAGATKDPKQDRRQI